MGAGAPPRAPLFRPPWGRGAAGRRGTGRGRRGGQSGPMSKERGGRARPLGPADCNTARRAGCAPRPGRHRPPVCFHFPAPRAALAPSAFPAAPAAPSPPPPPPRSPARGGRVRPSVPCCPVRGARGRRWASERRCGLHVLGPAPGTDLALAAGPSVWLSPSPRRPRPPRAPLESPAPGPYDGPRRALQLRLPAAGNCWLRQARNGRCQVLYKTELSKEECCGTGRLSTSWTEEDVNDNTLFKWMIFNGGAPNCIPCKGGPPPAPIPACPRPSPGLGPPSCARALRSRVEPCLSHTVCKTRSKQAPGTPGQAGRWTPATRALGERLGLG